MITIVIPGEARGKGRPRFARRGKFVQTYTDDKTASYENLAALAGNKAMKGAPPLLCALSVGITVFTTPPASWSKKKTAQALAGDIYPTSKPDLDNVAKCLLDALNGIAWKDDKQVVFLQAIKRYAEKAETIIKFEPMVQACEWAEGDA